jgi:rubredoxin
MIFLDLAAVEAEHEKVFASMRADLPDDWVCPVCGTGERDYKRA